MSSAEQRALRFTRIANVASANAGLANVSAVAIGSLRTGNSKAKFPNEVLRVLGGWHALACKAALAAIAISTTVANPDC